MFARMPVIRFKEPVGQRPTVISYLIAAVMAPKAEVTLTRIAGGTLDDHDNLRAAFKHVVDEIAAWVGVPDAHPVFSWRYAPSKTCAEGAQEHPTSARRASGSLKRIPLARA